MAWLRAIAWLGARVLRATTDPSPPPAAYRDPPSSRPVRRKPGGFFCSCRAVFQRVVAAQVPDAQFEVIPGRHPPFLDDPSGVGLSSRNTVIPPQQGVQSTTH